MLQRIFLILLLASASPAFSQQGYCGGFFSETKTSIEISPKAAKSYFTLSKLLKRNPTIEEWQADSEIGSLTQAPAFNQLANQAPREAANFRKWILKGYVAASKDLKRPASIQETAEKLQASVDLVEKSIGPNGFFKDLKAMNEEARGLAPKAFRDVVNLHEFSASYQQQALSDFREKERTVFTTAVANAPVNMDFWHSLVNYQNLENAGMHVFAADMKTEGLAPELTQSPTFVLLRPVQLTPDLTVNTMRVSATAADPLAGTDFFGVRGENQIFAGTKMRVRQIATMDNEVKPHRLYSTGAVTEAIYGGDRFVKTQREDRAAVEHDTGALIAEKSQGSTNQYFTAKQNGFYHLRHIEYIPEKKGFRDLDVFYPAEGKPYKAEISALILGDIHVGATDPVVVESLRGLIQRFKPKEVVIHDLADMLAISHHDRDKVITQAERAKSGANSLEQEIKQIVVFLNAMLAADPHLTVTRVQSNHDFRLQKWLQEGAFMRDPINTDIGLELAQAMRAGKDPLAYALEKFGLQTPERVVFLAYGDSKKVGPSHRSVELGLHGDAGANGGRGSMRTMRKGSGRIVYGHTHNYERFGGAVNVGTSTKYRLGYNNAGYSSWAHIAATVDSNGAIQAMEFKNGEWYAAKPVSNSEPNSFFDEGYPSQK